MRALNNLGLCLENGLGCQQDYQSAQQYYSKASKLGFAPAMCNMAHLLYKQALESESEFDRSEYLFDCQHWLRICMD